MSSRQSSTKKDTTILPKKMAPSKIIPRERAVELARYTCTFCPKTFSQIYNYHRHIEGHRKNPQCYPCWHCQKGYSRKGVLLRHVKEVHEFDKTKREKCPKCKRTFKFKTSLSNHLKIHSDESYDCSVCHKSFKCKRYLKTHMQRHSPTMHACKFCGKLFTAHVDVLKHCKVHREDFRCDDCLVIFPTIASKIVHCCSFIPQKRKFRITDEMACHFVSEIRKLNSDGLRPTLNEAMAIMRKSIPFKMCTQHILSSLSTRFDIKLREMRRKDLSPPPPPPETPPPPPMPSAGMENIPQLENIVEPDSLAKLPNTLTSVAIPKELLPSSSKVHWYLATQTRMNYDSQVEARAKAVVSMVKEEASKGQEHIKVYFNAKTEVPLMISISKTMQEKGFKCWNYREMNSGEFEGYFSLHIEWGHLSASH